MRRFICATLLISLCLQSTGVAAVGRDGTESIGATLIQGRVDLESAANWFIQTPILAMILTPERYAAMHVPPPERVVAPRVDANKTKLVDVQRPMSRGLGAPGTPPEILKRPLLPKDAEKLRAPATSPAGTSGSSMRASLSLQAPPIDFSLPKPAPRPTIDFSLPKPAATRKPSGIHPFDVNPSTPNTTGINPWWAYDEGGLPGTGKYMINVGNGNLMVQSDDVDIPERGIDLAFKRTYNSGSLNDTNAASGNDDGSPNENVYGNGWTNTFDTHLANNSSGGISVFDVDGARYDYTPNGTGCLSAPAGMHNTLCYDGGCGYFWGKTNGTVYYYWAPWLATNCGAGGAAQAAYAGRLYMIFGRNQNNWIRLTYSWLNGDASTSNNITQIVAAHQDGHQLVLSFGMVNGRPLMSSITLPDGSQVTYSYSTAHDLTTVAKLGNGSASSLPENYGYYAADKLAWTSNPRWNLAGGADGSFTNFYYDGNGRTTGVLLYGFANPTPSDGLSTPIQPGYTTGANTIRYSTYSYPTSGETDESDIDGHATHWIYDTSGRVTQTQRWTGASENLWLVTSRSWDAANNLTESTDSRGYATDYAYDANGNMIAVALPAITTPAGTFRPTTLFSYDLSNGTNYNNPSSTCKPNFTHQIGKDWTSAPAASDSLCPTQSGAEWSVWNYSDAAEPFGRSTDSYSAVGYHRSLSYNSASQGGDYGLLTGMTGDPISQADGSMRTPQETTTYDQFGNAVSFSSGSQHGQVTAVFDSLNRIIRRTDADGVTSYTCFYANGLKSYTETALQHQLDGLPSSCQTTAPSNAAAFTYDADGNLITETHHSGNQIGRTLQWYDGADRLVEVELPQDSHDVFQKPWITRTIYDLTQGGTVSITGATSVSFRAYGNPFKRQELLLPGTNQTASWAVGQPQLNNTQFQDTGGAEFDAADRILRRYRMRNDSPYSESFVYDGNGNYGEVSQHCNGISQCGTPQYDAAGQATSISYNDGTPTTSYGYDADGNVLSATSSTFGTESYTFDAGDRLTQRQDASGGGATSPATLNYHYYLDNTSSSLDISSSGLNQTSLFAYSYRDDGVTQQVQINLGANSAVGNSAINYSYSNAGRLLTRSESGPAANATGTSYTYDINNGSNTGVLSSENLPSAALSSFTYDAEGNVLSYNRNVYNVSNGSTGNFVYTTRNELVYDPRDAHSLAYFANGLSLVGTSSSNTDSWDARNAVLVSNGNPFVDENGNTTGTSFTFDGSGRQTGSDRSAVDRFGNPYDTTNTRQYDAENRLINGAQIAPNSHNSFHFNSTLTAYQWGPDGRLIRVGSTPSVLDANATTSQLGYDTLHWNGDRLLFTTNAQGAVDDIKINLPDGGTADITPLDPAFSGLTFWDSIQGMVSFCHNASGAAGTDQNSTSTFGCIKASGQTMQLPASLVTSGTANVAGGVGQGKLLGTASMGRFADGVNELQGNSAFDGLQNAATTPSPQGGNAHSPGTTLPYEIPQHGGACTPEPNFCLGGSPPTLCTACKPIGPWLPQFFYNNETAIFGMRGLQDAHVWHQTIGDAEIGVALKGLVQLVAGARGGYIGLFDAALNVLNNPDIPAGMYISDWKPNPQGYWGAGTFEEVFAFKSESGLHNLLGVADYDTNTGATMVSWYNDSGAHHIFITPAGNTGYDGESYAQTLAQYGESSDPGVNGNYTSVVIIGGRNNTPW